MIDSITSGVVYTSDPVNPESNLLLVSSIFGQGKLLVDGIVSPDLFIFQNLTEKLKTSWLQKRRKSCLSMKHVL